MIKKGDKRKKHYKCKDCAMFADEDADSPPYCPRQRPLHVRNGRR